MNRTITTHAGSAGHADAQAQPRGGIRFDWTAIGFSAWLLGGLFVDGWAHNHGKVDQMN